MSKRATLAVCAFAVLAVSLVPASALASGPVATTSKKSKPKKPSGVFKAKIGWFYTDSPDFPQTAMPPVVIHWGSCAKAGGVKLYFPLKQHIYEGDNGDFSTTKPTIASLSGPPLNPKDPFKATVYVGDLATPGKKTLPLKCMSLIHGKLKSIMTGGLKSEFIREDVNFNPPGSFTANDQLDLFGTTPSEQVVINRSCSEPGTPSVTVSSAALAPGPAGGAYVTLPFEDALGTFKGLVTPSKEAPPGDYEAIVSCGTGRVGVGLVGLH